MNHGRISSKVNRDCTIRVSCHRPGPCRIVPRKQAARHRTAGTHPPSHIHVQTSARRMGRAVETRRLQRPHLEHRRSSAEPRIPLRDRKGLAAFAGLRSESRAHGGGPAGAYGMHRRIRRHRFSGPGAGHRGVPRPPGPKQAGGIAGEGGKAVSGWREVPARPGGARRGIDRMESASGHEDLARALRCVRCASTRRPALRSSGLCPAASLGERPENIREATRGCLSADASDIPVSDADQVPGRDEALSRG